MSEDSTIALRVVGTVTRPHGVHGAVKVRPETDDPGRFEDLEFVYVGADEAKVVPYRVQSVGFQPVKSSVAVLLELEGIPDRDAAAGLSGLDVWARESDLPPLEEGEVFLSEMVGLRVLDTDGKELGEVTDVMDYPAHVTLCVALLSGSTSLVPFVPALVPEFDLDAGTVTVAAIEGLLDGEPMSERE